MSYRIIVCGGRTYGVPPKNILEPDYEESVIHAARERSQLCYVLHAFHEAFGVKELGHGAAPGADSLAGEWADASGVPWQIFPADWKAFGRSAGILRNREMLERFAPDFVIAFEGGAGTHHMCEFAKRRGVPVLKANVPVTHVLSATEKV